MLRVFIPLSVSIFIGALLIASIDLELLRTAVTSLSVIHVVGVVFILFIGHALAVFRWSTLLSFSGVSMSRWELLRVYFGNIPLARWVPLYGGDLMRVFFLRKHIPPQKGTSIIFLEAILDIEVLFLLSLFGSIFFRNDAFALIAFLGLLVPVIFLWCVQKKLFSKFIQWDLLRKIEGEVFISWRAVFLALFPTVGMWLTVLVGAYLCFGALGVDVALLQVLATQPLVVLASLLPVTFGGLGTREATTMLLYYGAASPELVLMSGFTYSVISVVLIPLLVSPISYYVWQQIIDEKT